MIDSHAHLNFRAFKKDVRRVVHEAKKAGIEAIVVPGAKIDSSKRAVELAQMFPILFAAVGFHPHHVNEYKNSDSQLLSDLSREKRVVAIGECGLDYHRYGNSKDQPLNKKKQMELFRIHFRLALQQKIPLIIHCRNAWKDIFSSFPSFPHTQGVFHCWTGTVREAKKALDLGYYISFSGILTYNNAKKIQETAAYIPLDRILVETDSPFLSPEGVRHLRNEPKHVKITAEYLARIKKTSIEQIIFHTTSNAKKLFQL